MILHHGGTEARRKLVHEELTGQIINFNVAALVRGGIVRKVI